MTRSLAPADRASTIEAARMRAKVHDDPITGARLLLALGDGEASEVLLLARHATLQGGGDYDRLVPLAQALEKKGGYSARSRATGRSSSRS